MKNAIAIAIAKAREKRGGYSPEPQEELRIDEAVSKSSLGVLIVIAAFFGMGGVICLIGGIVHSGGVTDFVKGWFSALAGI